MGIGILCKCLNGLKSSLCALDDQTQMISMNQHSRRLRSLNNLINLVVHVSSKVFYSQNTTTTVLSTYMPTFYIFFDMTINPNYRRCRNISY